MKTKKKPLYQWCIKETYANEVLALPKTVDIAELTFEVGFSLKRVVSVIPTRLAKMGVTYMRDPSTSVEARGLLTGDRDTMLANAQQICHELQLDFRHMKVQRMLIHHGGDIIFTRMAKNMSIGHEGKTQRIKVLGFVSSTATEEKTKKLISLLNAKKVRCEYSTEVNQTVICYE